MLLDSMGSGPLCSGRFLTMHKRRRKKLTTRSLSQDHAILDDVHHGQVQVGDLEDGNDSITETGCQSFGGFCSYGHSSVQFLNLYCFYFPLY